MRWHSDGETHNYYFCASLVLLSHLLSRIKLFKGGSAHKRRNKRTRHSTNWETGAGLLCKWNESWASWAVWAELKTKAGASCEPERALAARRWHTIIGSRLWSGAADLEVTSVAAWGTFEQSELWEPIAINRHSGAILSWAFLNALLLCFYCSVIITRLRVCPLWENRQGATWISAPDPPRDILCHFYKGKYHFELLGGNKRWSGAKFAPVNLLIFSD